MVIIVVINSPTWSTALYFMLREERLRVQIQLGLDFGAAGGLVAAIRRSLVSASVITEVPPQHTAPLGLHR